MTFFSHNCWELSESIKYGKIDFILIKPINAIFIIFFRHIRVPSFFNIFITISVLIYFGTKISLSWPQWTLLPFLILLAFTLMISIEILISLSMFWTIEGHGVNFLRMQLQTLGHWPDFVYQFFARKFFTVFLPILLIGSAPVHFLKDFSNWPLLAGMILAIIILWILIAIFWKLALKQYESASS